MNYNDQLQKVEAAFENFQPTGSEKQITWAKDIVRFKINSVKNMNDNCVNNDVDTAKYAMFCYFIRNAMGNKKDAKFWIDEKDEAVAALGRFAKTEQLKPYFEAAKLKF